MAGNEVLYEKKPFGVEPGDLERLASHRLDAEHDVAKELSWRRVVRNGRPLQLYDLADVVQEGAGQQEITVEGDTLLKVVAGDAVTRRSDGKRVLEETVEVGVMVPRGRLVLPE